MENIEGVLLVDKREGILSTSVVNRIKKLLRKANLKIKVGHGGTLDKFASGLLIILLGKGTKLFEKIKLLPKEYVATVRFGEVRTTDDIYGEIINTFSIKNLSKRQIETALKSFEGEILQIPPAYSSIHIEGKRAYKIAKKDYYNALKLLKPRRVNIYKIKLINFNEDLNEAEIFVKCSGGTYIRSIARDLGQLLEVGAYLKNLRREKIGELSVKEAIRDDKIISFQDIVSNLIPIEDFKSRNHL